MSEADSAQVAGLKDEGNKLFGRKEYTKAFEAYEKALKMLPEGHSEAVLLHSNKAACSMMLKKYKEAVNECTSALDVAPNNQKALLRRAKALEAMGLYKQALSDVQKVNKLDDAPPENQATEKRLKDILAGKKPANAGSSLVGRRKASSTSGAQRQQISVFQAKCTLGDETRLLHIGPSVSYAEMLEGVRAKFPDAPPFALKFLDREGDLVTVTSRQDLQRAMQEAIAASQSSPHGPRLSNTLPPIRLQLVPVASEADVPPPPPEEQQQLVQFIQKQAKLLEQARAIEAQQRATAAKEQQPAAQPEMVEIDQWIVDFAHLFRDSTGLDFDRHVELHNLGFDKIQEAMDSSLRSDKALPLLDAAADKFAEVTISGLLQWGHTFTMVARKHLDDAAADGKPISDVQDVVEEQWAKAEAKYNEALAVKGEHVDALQYLGSLEMERAKLAAGINLGTRKPEEKPPAEDGAEGTAEKAAVPAKQQKTEAELQKEQQEAQREAQEWSARAQCSAIDALSPEQAAAGDGHWDKCFAYVERMVAAVPEEQRKVRPQQPAAGENASANGDKAAADGKPADAESAADQKPAEDGASAETGTAPDGKGEAEAKAGEGAEKKAPEEDYYIYANVLLNWGNILYERSQLAARAGQDWRPMLDEAVEHFRDAGCAPPDIRGALKNHYRAADLDLGPDPEPQPEKVDESVPTANGTAAAAAAEDAVKGLPSLGPKPKGGAPKKEATATA
jgi:tetratricopeptide (TPR) repeat protein